MPMKYDSYLDNIEHNISFYVYIRNCFKDIKYFAVMINVINRLVAYMNLRQYKIRENYKTPLY